MEVEGRPTEGKKAVWAAEAGGETGLEMEADGRERLVRLESELLTAGGSAALLDGWTVYCQKGSGEATWYYYPPRRHAWEGGDKLIRFRSRIAVIRYLLESSVQGMEQVYPHGVQPPKRPREDSAHGEANAHDLAKLARQSSRGRGSSRGSSCGSSRGKDPAPISGMQGGAAHEGSGKAGAKKSTTIERGSACADKNVEKLDEVCGANTMTEADEAAEGMRSSFKPMTDAKAEGMRSRLQSLDMQTQT